MKTRCCYNGKQSGLKRQCGHTTRYQRDHRLLVTKRGDHFQRKASGLKSRSHHTNRTEETVLDIRGLWVRSQSGDKTGDISLTEGIGTEILESSHQ